MAKDMYKNFKFLWRAEFSDGKKIVQHPEDLYSKHNPQAEYNPSSFRDILDYQEAHRNAKLMKFCLFNDRETYTVSFESEKRPEIYYDASNKYGIQTKHYRLFSCKRDLSNVRPIYYRRMSINLQTQEKTLLFYTLGFQGTEENGRNFKEEIKVI